MARKKLRMASGLREKIMKSETRSNVISDIIYQTLTKWSHVLPSHARTPAPRSDNFPHPDSHARMSPSHPGPYRTPAEERASRMASRLRQKSMCSFKPWLSVTNVREHTGQCCSVLSSFLIEVGREELVPPDWNRSDLSGSSPK